jgi:succinate-acetate transporter protein
VTISHTDGGHPGINGHTLFPFLTGIGDDTLAQSMYLNEREHRLGNMHFIITFIFLVLAVINYVQPSPLCTVPGTFGFLSSMWFMYLIMAIAHLCLWLTLANKTHSEDCGCSIVKASTDK